MDERGRSPAWQSDALWDGRQEELVEAHLRRIFLLIYRLVGNVADAQDLTQEAFIKALQRQQQLRDPEKAAQWLSRIATHTALDFLRKRSRSMETELDALPAPPPVPGGESPEQRLLREEQDRMLESCLSQLTVRERAALVLRDLEDLPAEEVARRLRCSKATVRSHIAHARIKFRRLWERRLK